MALTQTFTVIIKGASFFDGEIDGKQTNSGCLHIEDELETRSGRNKGSRTVEYKTLDAGLVKPLVANHEFPMSAEITIEKVNTKRGTGDIVTAIKPLGRVAGNPNIDSKKAA
ncbi:MAG: hypothetical protein I4O48_09935 [Ralstonia sp.]|jgi:hypothetical protein|uniref:Uncharacterized protein n=2 Tax=Ralstonia TaxID=48736 RepID=A0AAD2BTH5_9RALS|nr:hypothetical protein [Ralstonia sp. LMG 18095]MCL6468626.1 hypothetical protein [Ralstonia sp.]CAJ0802845.1 hypothetical protein R77560_03804 [Ralstonia sp. LMG 18095]CPR56018.1 Uncharacterised protein [Chlamydia trachomatis]